MESAGDPLLRSESSAVSPGVQSVLDESSSSSNDGAFTYSSNYESLDFEVIINSFSRVLSTCTSRLPQQLSLNKKKKKTIIGYSGRTFVRWLLTGLTGLMTGATAIFIVWSIGKLTSLREKVSY